VDEQPSRNGLIRRETRRHRSPPADDGRRHPLKITFYVKYSDQDPAGDPHGTGFKIVPRTPEARARPSATHKLRRPTAGRFWCGPAFTPFCPDRCPSSMPSPTLTSRKIKRIAPRPWPHGPEKSPCGGFLPATSVQSYDGLVSI